MTNTELYGADLTNAKVDGAMFTGARYDGKTRWPGKSPEDAVFEENPDV
jgi:hypothetical protein